MKHHICPRHGQEVCEQTPGATFPRKLAHSCQGPQPRYVGNFSKKGKPVRTPK